MARKNSIGTRKRRSAVVPVVVHVVEQYTIYSIVKYGLLEKLCKNKKIIFLNFKPSLRYEHANVVEHLWFISIRLFVPQAQWHSRSNAGSMSLAASAENMSRKNSVGGETVVKFSDNYLISLRTIFMPFNLKIINCMKFAFDSSEIINKFYDATRREFYGNFYHT